MIKVESSMENIAFHLNHINELICLTALDSTSQIIKCVENICIICSKCLSLHKEIQTVSVRLGYSSN